ncbi:MAG: glycosyltransferase family 4 protein [Minisyncoccia bacterium]
MKKLVLATPLYPPEAGGPATFAKILEEALPERGWKVEVVKFVDVRHHPKFLRHLVYGWRVFKKAWRADMVLALDPVSTGLPAFIAAHFAGKPFFVRIAGDYAWEQGVQRWGISETLDVFVSRRKLPLGVRALKAVQTFVARRAKRIIVPSKYLARIVTLWDISPLFIQVAYNGIPEVQEEYPQPEISGPYIVTVGRLVPWKGMGVVIEAFTVLSKTHKKLSLVIVGDGPERAKLEARIRNLGLGERVICTGNVSHEETLSWLSHAEVFVLNTRYEGLSHLILEAFALATPVATTHAGGNRELISEGETGLVFSYADQAGIVECVSDLMKNKKLKTKITKNAAALCSEFTNARMVNAVIEVLSV